MPAALTTVESFRLFKGIPDSQTLGDGRIQQIIDAVSDFIWDYTASDSLTEGSGTGEAAKPRVQLAANAMVAHWYDQQGGVGGSVAGERDTAGAFAMPTSTLQLLAPFRVMGFGAES